MRTLTLILGLLYSSFIVAQDPIWVDKCDCGAPTFMRIDQADNVYIGTIGPFLIKLSPSGSLLWKKHLVYDGYEFNATNALLDEDSSCLVITGTLAWQGNKRLFIAKVSLATGDIYDYTINTKYFPGDLYAGNSEAYFIHAGLFKASNDAYYLLLPADTVYPSLTTMLSLRYNAELDQTGEYWNNDYATDLAKGIISTDGEAYFPIQHIYTDCIIKKVDSDMITTDWEFQFDDYQKTVSIIPAPNGVFVMRYETVPGAYRRTTVSRLKDKGTEAELTWNVVIPGEDVELNWLYFDQARNHVFASGSYYSAASGMAVAETTTTCFNAENGQIIWSTTVSGVDSTYGVSSLKTDASGRLFIVGAFGSIGNIYFAGYYDLTGQYNDYVFYQPGFKHNMNGAATNLTFNSNNKLIVTGTASEGYSANWTTTLMYDGLEPIVPTTEPSLLTPIGISPNPANHFLHISSSEKIPFSYQMTDFYGKEILKDDHSNDAVAISVDNLQEGVYFLRIKSANDTQVIRKIIIKH